MATFISDVSQKTFPESEKVLGSSLTISLLNLIQKEIPTFNFKSNLSTSELEYFHGKFINQAIKQDSEVFSKLDEKVIKAIKNKTSISKTIQNQSELSYGQKLADKVALFGGSWTFIMAFGCFIVIWIGINIYFLANKGFDPYPFILLNLILSCLASIQAPILMMSQNRLEEKDRERSEKDYMINLKSEFEIRQLHDKLDHLLIHQQQELIEFQKIQIEKLNQIIGNKNI